MGSASLKQMTDNRLLLFASIEYIEKTPFTVIVAHNQAEIIDEIVFPYDGVQSMILKINELIRVYSYPYIKSCEMETDNRELMKAAASIAGISVRPKRKQDIELFTRRALERHNIDNVLYNLYEIEPLVPPKNPSKLRTWLIKTLRNVLKRLEGENKR